MRRILLLSLAVAVVVACGGDGDDREELARGRRAQAERVAREAGLPPGVRTVLGLAAQAPAHTFTVVYRSSDGASRTTLVQDPPRRRVEVDSEQGTDLTLVRDDGTYQCRRMSGPWQCAAATRPADAPGLFSATAMDRTIESLSSARASYDFQAIRRTLAGARARCMVAVLKPGQAPDPAKAPIGELCVSSLGAPLLVRTAASTLTAISYRPSADEDAFDVPARPVTTTA